MASIFFLKSKTEIDYSAVSGRVRSFVRHDGRCLFDEDNHIAIEGWERDLIDCVIKNGLNVNDGKGYHAFVRRLAEEGKVGLQ